MGKFPADAPVVLTRCPELREYDKNTMTKAASELRSLLATNINAVTPRLVRDYRVLRDQCRAYGKP